MDLTAIQKSISEIGDLAKAGNVEVTKQLEVIKAQSAASDARILDLEQKTLVRTKGVGQRDQGAINFGALLANDPKLAALRTGEIREARLVQKMSLAMACKSVLVETGTSGSSPETGFPTPTEFISSAPANAPGRRLQVLQALPHLPVTAGTAVMPELSSSSDGSAVQEYQGGAKGQSTLTVLPKALPMAQIATWLQASKQLIDDVATLPTFLQSWLSYFVLRKYENLIVSGDGSASNGHILGLANAGTAFTSGQTYNADKIGDAAFTALPSYGYAADLILVNSSDYFGIVSQRATSGDGQYIGGGWSAANPGTLWGIKAIATPALASGHAIVLDSQLVSILDRQEIQFLIGYQGTDFINNVFTYLAELRGQLAIGDPHAVQVVALA